MLAAARELPAAVGRGLLNKYNRAVEELWTRAVPEQQRLTIQLARNSVYFVLSCILIRFYGDQLAV